MSAEVMIRLHPLSYVPATCCCCCSVHYCDYYGGGDEGDEGDQVHAEWFVVVVVVVTPLKTNDGLEEVVHDNDCADLVHAEECCGDCVECDLDSDAVGGADGGALEMTGGDRCHCHQ